MNTPDYAYWTKGLAIGKGRRLSKDEARSMNTTTEPQPGFYRKRSKDGPDVPVAIWHAGGQLVARAGKDPAEPDDIWTWCCDWPISEQEWRDVAEGGKPWPDEPPAPALGHNAPPPTGDPLLDLKNEFAAEKETAEAFLKKPITTQQQADQAAVWSKRLSLIAKKATDLHKVEKQPHLDAGRAVDDRWRDLKEEPDALSKRLKRHLDDFLREQARLEEERQRKARAEADRIRREAEEAAAKAAAAERAAEEERQRREREAQDAGKVGTLFTAEVDEAAKQQEAERAARAAEIERLQRQAAEAEREAEARNANAGRTGAKVALRTFVSARIVDYDAALAALKNRPEIRDVVEALANRAVKSGVDLPGVERVEEKRAA